MSIQIDEVCKVRCHAVGQEGSGYTLAILKRMNKNTARIIVFHDSFSNGKNVVHTVQLHTLWKVKAKQRAQLELKARRHIAPANKASLVASVPPPLFIHLEVYSSTVHLMGLQVAAKLTLGNSSTQLYIAHASVLDFTGDAIVSAANNGCIHGGGIDGLVNFRGGHDIEEARKALPELDEFGTRCNTGDAKITISGQLPCDKVIHAVGPRFGYSGDHSDNLKRLESAYKNSLERAREADIKSIGFCLLSAGIFRGSCSLSAVVLCGLETIARNAYSGLETVIVCAFTNEEKEAFSSILQGMPLMG